MRISDWNSDVCSSDLSYLKLGGGLERTQAEFRKFSARDAELLPAYYDALDHVAELLRDLALRVPPNVGGGCARCSTARGRDGVSPPSASNGSAMCSTDRKSTRLNSSH